MLMSSTITTIENINEYIVYIIDNIDVENSIVNSAGLVEFELDLNANTAIQNDKSYTVFQTPNAISTDFDVSSKIDFHLEVNELDLAGTIFSFIGNLKTIVSEIVLVTYADVSFFWLSAEEILNYQYINFSTTLIPTKTYLIVWKLIQGTISFSSYAYTPTQISVYANTQVSALQLATFSSSANHVTGTNTIFLSDFAVNDIFLANNEFGKINILFNNTEMDIYVPPSSAYTNVPAYKQISVSTSQPFDSTTITFDNQTLTFDQG